MMAGVETRTEDKDNKENSWLSGLPDSCSAAEQVGHINERTEDRESCHGKDNSCLLAEQDSGSTPVLEDIESCHDKDNSYLLVEQDSGSTPVLEDIESCHGKDNSCSLAEQDNASTAAKAGPEEELEQVWPEMDLLADFAVMQPEMDLSADFAIIQPETGLSADNDLRHRRLARKGVAQTESIIDKRPQIQRQTIVFKTGIDVELISVDEREYSIVGEGESEDDQQKADVIIDSNSELGNGDTLSRPQKSFCSQHSDIRQSVDAILDAGSARSRRAFLRQKAQRVQKVLLEEPVSVHDLRQLAISRGGLLNAELRRKAWPILLSIDVNNIPPKPEASVLRGHRDYNQVEMDVKRSDKRFPPGIQQAHRMSLQDKMIDVIMRVLVRHPELHYYQGFHDIVVTILLVADEDLCFAIVEKLSLHHLRDFMESTMERTQQLLDYVPPLLRRANPQLLLHMERAELGSVFCISWMLTWFGHVLGDIQSILRMFDFFIACHPLMPIYVMGAVVLYREKEILATEADMPALYQLLTHIPDTLPIEHLLSTAGDLYIQYPPTELANEALCRFRRAQEEAAQRRAQVKVRENTRKRKQRKLFGYLPDGNVTFTKVTILMLGAVVGMAAYALISAMGWDWTAWMRH